MSLPILVLGKMSDRNQTALKMLGYKIGALMPGIVSIKGKRYDYHVLYKDLTGRYGFTVARRYAKPGLYPTIEVEKVKDARLSRIWKGCDVPLRPSGSLPRDWHLAPHQ